MLDMCMTAEHPLYMKQALEQVEPEECTSTMPLRLPRSRLVFLRVVYPETRSHEFYLFNCYIMKHG